LYSVGNIYNSIKGVSGKEFIARNKALENGKSGYSSLDARHPRMQHKPGAGFDDARKSGILKENMRRNNNVLRSDKTGKILQQPTKSTRGVAPPRNEAQIDHIFPKSMGGPNSFGNAQVIERSANIAKSGNPSFADYLRHSIPDKGSVTKAFGFGFANIINSAENMHFSGGVR
jgi:hypothetical protein